VASLCGIKMKPVRMPLDPNQAEDRQPQGHPSFSRMTMYAMEEPN
jgi:hypothetical protein